MNGGELTREEREQAQERFERTLDAAELEQLEHVPSAFPRSRAASTSCERRMS